ncbi:von Willebrand factor type A domain [Prauserella aidingensis]|nr:von Willebrand factor type A domain [Prauserella aidingensis]
MDLSSSVTGYVDDIKGALDSFVESLQGTPSQAALFTFGTDSPANGYDANTGLLPVATAGDNRTFRELYTDWGNPDTNYTNWDRGIGAVADANAAHPESERFDMAVVLTDGNPTVYGPNPTPNGQLDDRNSGYTRFRELGNATASANLLKSQGTRILVVGVGSGVDGPDAAYNLRTISGRDPYTGDNIREADYFQTDDYEPAGHALRDLVLANCAPSVSVVKQIVPYGGTTENAYAGTGWEFTGTPSPPATVTPTTGRTDSTGAMNFDLGFDTETADLQVEETQQSGYTSMPEETECVAKESGEDQLVPITQDPGNPEAFTVEGVGVNSVVSCTVYNRAPDLDSASVTVDKQWEVTRTTGPNGETTTDTYAAGDQPTGLNSSLTLAGPDGAGAGTQAWGDPREGYSVSEDGSVHVDENVTIQPSGCELTGTDIDGQAMTPGTGADMELTSGSNEWTITNEVECHSRLRLNKNVASGDLGPQWWQLRAIGPDDVLPGPNGRTTTDWAEVTPGATYQLAERADTPEPEGDAPHDIVHYVQNDQRMKDPDLSTRSRRARGAARSRAASRAVGSPPTSRVP